MAKEQKNKGFRGGLAEAGLEITEVKVYPFKGKRNDTLMAFASVTLNSCIVITGIRIIDGRKGAFVSMPQTKGSDDKWYDVTFPLTGEAREDIQSAVLAEYEK